MPTESPNFLFVMADQLSALATSPYGNPDVLTPHMEQLARQGLVFERAYCNFPLCAPSRASMVTGRLAGTLPVSDNSEEFSTSIPTFVHHLRRAGYRTVLSGKMHFVGPDQLHGFEERLTTDIYPADFMWTKLWSVQGEPPRRVGLPGDAEIGNSYERQMAQMVTESGPVPWSYQLDYDEEVHHQALARLRQLARRRGREQHQPWLLCVSYTHPHDPYVAILEYWNRYEGRDIRLPAAAPSGHTAPLVDIWANAYHGVDRIAPTHDHIAASRRGYYASTSYIDDKLGELVAELERLGAAANTYVIFTSDHGDQCGEHGMWFKRTVREWSTRVPLIVAGPDITAGRRVHQNVSLVDLYPTFLNLAQLDLPGGIDWSLDGHSLAPFLHSEQSPAWLDSVIIENNGEATIKPIRALVYGHYKYVYVHDREELLFDHATDPDEWFDHSRDPAYQDVLNSLRTRCLNGWDGTAMERTVHESQRRRSFLKDALFQGWYTAWDFQPYVDARHTYVRRGQNIQWDPALGTDDRPAAF
ncbi:MAG: choline-sulfatase [Chloroflexi bacterium]|nr:choline-sulfatase [Chloroflexota bacterium]